MYRKGAATNYIKHWKQVIANGVVFFLKVEVIRQRCIVKEGFVHWKTIADYLKFGESSDPWDTATLGIS